MGGGGGVKGWGRVGMIGGLRVERAGWSVGGCMGGGWGGGGVFRSFKGVVPGWRRR